jgi:hypothetical protein
MILLGRIALLLALTVSVVRAQSVEVSLTPEVFQVLELPLTVTNPSLVKTKGGYVLKCSLSSASEFRQLGFRYSLAIIDPATGKSRVISRNEGFSLGPYQTKTVTFRAPLRLTLKGDERLVLMPEQVISTDYVWEVMQAKEALASYIEGDFSNIPRVLRVLNQVDAPTPLRVVF